MGKKVCIGYDQFVFLMELEACLWRARGALKVIQAGGVFRKRGAGGRSHLTNDGRRLKRFIGFLVRYVLQNGVPQAGADLERCVFPKIANAQRAVSGTFPDVGSVVQYLRTCERRESGRYRDASTRSVLVFLRRFVRVLSTHYYRLRKKAGCPPIRSVRKRISRPKE